jgi:hypothetical protein
MTIHNFEIPPSAQVFKILKRLSKKKIKDLFSECSEKRIGRYFLEELKVPIAEGKMLYSIVIFKIENEPTFLKETQLVETKYAYLLLIEFENFLFIFKKYVDNPDNKLLPFITPFEYSTFSAFKANDGTEYEKVVMNNMSISNAVIKNRAYEAKNLRGLLPSNSASRSIASNFRLNAAGEIYSVVPNTSRLTFRSPKLRINDLAKWCKGAAHDLMHNVSNNSFINNFASPINLEKIKTISHPTALFLDLEELDARLREGNGDWKLMLKTNDESVALDKIDVDKFMRIFKSPILLIKNEKKEDSFHLNIKGITSLGDLRLGKNSMTLRSALGDNILIQNELGGEGSFVKYINAIKPFSVVFDNPSYMYFSRYAFEDKKLLNNIEGMMSIFIDDYDFSSVESEKEKPHLDTATDFPFNSLFYAVEKNLGGQGKIMICDDMDDEWADHIILEAESNPPVISFVHSKFVKKDSYGASKLHEVVSQALKNLGRANADVSEYKVKYENEWHGNYENTNISKVRTENNWIQIETALTTIIGNPNSIRKSVLATPFFSKAILKSKMEALARGEKSDAAYTQVIWLINTFISSCRDYNVQPYVLCKK